MTLTEFLLTRIAEDEAQEAEENGPDALRVDDPEGKYAWECDWCEHVGWVDVASLVGSAWLEHARLLLHTRCLAECEAKRRMIVRCEEMLLASVPMAVHLAKQTLLDMARPHADHPDYRPEWRP